MSHIGSGYLIFGPKLVVPFRWTMELSEGAALLEEEGFDNF